MFSYHTYKKSLKSKEAKDYKAEAMKLWRTTCTPSPI